MKKIYKYRTLTFGAVSLSFFSVLSILAIVFGGINGNAGYIGAGVAIFVAIWIIFLTAIACKVHIPIRYDSSSVKYKDKEINWKNVKITAYACLTRSWQYGYFLVFSDRYLIGSDLKKAIKDGFYVYLYFNTLRQLLEYYPYEIKIVEPSDMYNYVEVLKSNKKTNELFDEHNAQCREITIDN